MDRDVIQKTALIALILGTAGSIAAFFFLNFAWAAGILSGMLWGCLNFYLIKVLLQELFLSKQKDFIKIAALFGVKFPFLYFGGYALLAAKIMPAESLAGGFSLLFLAIFIMGLVRVFSEREAVQ